MKKSRTIIRVLLIVAVAAAGYYGWDRYQSGQQAATKAASAQKSARNPIRVSTAPVDGETNFALNADVDFHSQSDPGLKFGNGDIFVSVSIPSINTFAFCGLQKVTSNGLAFTFDSSKGEFKLNGGECLVSR